MGCCVVAGVGCCGCVCCDGSILFNVPAMHALQCTTVDFASKKNAYQVYLYSSRAAPSLAVDRQIHSSNNSSSSAVDHHKLLL